ncbi:alginate export family protein [Robiginitomaculum antarcticum]|uniref:alginate export family protein n=1 Tax=Robiginitomaculum antarcticum TaxID=437507 RepID=UPI00036EBA09|nr:alginate export family protein [Robiginitomaculum antarcticum]
MKTVFFVSVTAIAMLRSIPAYAADNADTPADAITNGKATIDTRYRLETVDQDGFAEGATAQTIRTKLKYTTGNFKGFSAVLEVENVLVLQNDYNSTINGKTNFPVIADPKSTEINQAYLAYKGESGATVKAGRIGMNMTNQRFVGTVGWRQDDQTYDSLVVMIEPIDNLMLTGSYVWNVNRIFSDDNPLGNLDTDTTWVSADYTGVNFGTLTAYGLFIDLNDAPVFGLSSQTLGLRFAGKTKASDTLSLLYEAEYATQSDYKDNPVDYSADYYHLLAGVASGGFTLKAGYEVLGSHSGNAAFKTPLATLHKFNGWTDKFLNTPNGGLEDLYASMSYKVQADGPLKGLKFDVIYHDFSADVGGDYGSEINLQVAKNINQNYSVALKYGSYNADGFATDTDKLWISLGAKF